MITNVCSHDGVHLPADAMAHQLQDVNVSEVEVIAVEELHFFPDVLSTFAAWEAAGKLVLCTTVSTNVTGEQMPVLTELLESDLTVELIHNVPTVMFAVEREQQSLLRGIHP